jgi:enamine deaminase RidA (YjgF/YER057c/UK114 family)
MSMEELVFVQVFCPDVSLYPKLNEVYKTYFGKDYPARAFVGSGQLLRGRRGCCLHVNTSGSEG